MLEHVLERIAKVEEGRPKAVLMVFLVLTVFLTSGFALIKTSTSQESLVPDTVPEIKALNYVRDELGGASSNIILIFRDDDSSAPVPDMRAKDVLSAMQLISEQAMADRFVARESSILDFVDIKATQNEIDQALSGNPSASGLLSSDNRMALMIFSLENGLSTVQEDDVLYEVRSIVDNTPLPAGVRVDVAGSVALNDEISSSIGQSVGSVTFIGFAGVLVVLYLFFRRTSFVFIAIMPIVLGSLWTFGTMGLLGIALSTQLVGVFSIIIGLGIDFGIHILHRFEEDKKKYEFEVAVYNAVQHVGKGLALTTITTVIGFLALTLAQLPLLRDFAVALSFGVVYSLIAAIGVIPPLLVLVERRAMRRKGRKKKRASRRKREGS